MGLYRYKAKVDRIVDADTIDAWVSCGFDIWTHQRLRLARIDAWEVRGEEREQGLLAKTRVESLLPKGSTIYITTLKGRGKFGRYLAEIDIPSGKGESTHFNLNDLLLAEGHAKLYEG